MDRTALIEHHGEALFVLSDQMRQHCPPERRALWDAYEKVVSTFAALAQPKEGSGDEE